MGRPKFLSAKSKRRWCTGEIFIFQIDLKKHRDEAIAVMDGLDQGEGFLPIPKQLKLGRRPKSRRNDEFLCAFTGLRALSAIDVDHRPHLEAGRNL